MLKASQRSSLLIAVAAAIVLGAIETINLFLFPVPEIALIIPGIFVLAGGLKFLLASGSIILLRRLFRS